MRNAFEDHYNLKRRAYVFDSYGRNAFDGNRKIATQHVMHRTYMRFTYAYEAAVLDMLAVSDAGNSDRMPCCVHASEQSCVLSASV